MSRVEKLVEELNLEPHPEGGFYREVYRSEATIRRDAAALGFAGERACSTSIYFLLPGFTYSAFHRIRSDELWHFYEGSPLVLHVIAEAGAYREIRLGPPDSGGCYQIMVPKDHWFAARCVDPNGFSLVGCTVSPGFDFADFELADRKVLSERYPAHQPRITELTRSA